MAEDSSENRSSTIGGWAVAITLVVAIIALMTKNEDSTNETSKKEKYKKEKHETISVEFETIRKNMKNMTSAKWNRYTKSLKGKRVENWSGYISDVEEQRSGGYEVKIDMDKPGSMSVQDIYIEDISKDKAMRLDIKEIVVFSGTIKSINNVMGSCAITLKDPEIY